MAPKTMVRNQPVMFAEVYLYNAFACAIVSAAANICAERGSST